MRIRMKTRLAGPGGTAEPGAIVDRDKATAYDMIERGYAEQVDDPSKLGGEPATPAESAVAPPAELAVGAGHRRRKGGRS